MRVQFDYTIDDVVDSAARTLFGSEAGRRNQASTRVANAFSVAALAGLFVAAFVPANPDARIAVGLIVGIAAGAVRWLRYPAVVRTAWRKQYLALFGSEGPFTCEVELRHEGVWARQNDTQVLYEWPGLAAIEDTPDSIDFRTRTGGYLVVRDRAFWSPEERDKFLATARQYLDMYAEDSA
jgi:hypothetical protein